MRKLTLTFILILTLLFGCATSCPQTGLKKAEPMALEYGWFDHDGYKCMIPSNAESLTVDYVLFKNMCGGLK